jgi:hypothetical protein
VDVDLNHAEVAIANAIKIALLKLSTPPPGTIDLHNEDRLYFQRDLAATNRIVITLDEKLEDKSWSQHQKPYVFRQPIPDSPAHAPYKTFLSLFPFQAREYFPEFVSFQASHPIKNGVLLY